MIVIWVHGRQDWEKYKQLRFNDSQTSNGDTFAVVAAARTISFDDNDDDWLCQWF